MTAFLRTKSPRDKGGQNFLQHRLASQLHALRKSVLRYRFQVVSQSESTVPFVDLVPSEQVYHQILVNTDPTKSDALQVTFDDNKDDNCWSYHPGKIHPNVSGLSYNHKNIVIPVIIYHINSLATMA